MQRIRIYLPNEDVNKLVESLFLNTLSKLAGSPWTPVILTAEDSLAKLCRDKGYLVFLDSGNSLNKAVISAVNRLKEKEISLIMPDIPEIDKKSINKLNSVCKLFQRVVSPSHDKGISFAKLTLKDWENGFLGKDSYKKVVEMMKTDNLEFSVIKIQNLLHDIDEIDDFRSYSTAIKLLEKNKLYLVNPE